MSPDNIEVGGVYRGRVFRLVIATRQVTSINHSRPNGGPKMVHYEQRTGDDTLKSSRPLASFAEWALERVE